MFNKSLNNKFPVIVTMFFLCIFIFLIHTSTCYAANPPGIGWQQVVETPGYTINAISVQQTSDNSYVFTGYKRDNTSGKNDLWLMKLDASGNKQWEKSFSRGGIHECGYSVQETQDGCYLICGVTSTFYAKATSNQKDISHDDLWLIKTDAQGQVIWEQVLDRDSHTSQDPVSGAISYFLTNDHPASKGSVAITQDGGCVLAASTQAEKYDPYSGSGYDAGRVGIWLAKIDSSGNKQWESLLERTDANNYPISIEETNDNGFVLSTYFFDPSKWEWDASLIKTNSQGEKVWEKVFDETQNDKITNVLETSDGGFIFADELYSDTAGIDSGLLIKTDANGNQEWNTPLDVPLTNGFSPVYLQKANDGGYAIFGEVYDFDWYTDICLIKTDLSGYQEWTKTLGGSSDEWVEFGQHTSDGGYIIAGGTHSYGDGNAWLVKLESTSYEIQGTVFKDESGQEDINGDPLYQQDTDIAIPGATVRAFLNGQYIAETQTNNNGEYNLLVPSSETNYTLKVTLPAEMECYDPEEDDWDYWSTIDGQVEGVSSSTGSADIPITYRLLNYGSRDFNWELWHIGPTWQSSDNVILVHGIQCFNDLEPKKSTDIYMDLDELLQLKEYGQYNVWQFEYAHDWRGTPLSVNTYSERLSLALDVIGSLAPTGTNNVIAHSMGGIVARGCIQNEYFAGTNSRIDKLLMLATPNMGLMDFYAIPLNMSGLYSWLLSKPAAELRADSRYMWDLNTNINSSTAPETAVVGGTINYPTRGKQDNGVEIASVSLVESNPDGSIANSFYFAGMNEEHTNFDNIGFDDPDHPDLFTIDFRSKDNEVFYATREFLTSGISGLEQWKPPEEPKTYGGNPFLTFALKKRAPLYYPVVETLDGQGNVVHQYSTTNPENQLETIPGPELTKWTDYVWTQGATTSDGSYIYTVQLYPDDAGEVRIYYNDNEYATVKMAQGQSTYVTAPIDNMLSDTTIPENRGFANTFASAGNGGVAWATQSGVYQKQNIFIPPDSLSEDTVIYVYEPVDNRGLASAVEFGPTGTVFNQPATITVEYKNSDIPPGFNESNIRLLVWENGQWNIVPGSTVNIQDNTVSGEVNHLSLYGAGIPNSSQPSTGANIYLIALLGILASSSGILVIKKQRNRKNVLTPL